MNNRLTLKLQILIFLVYCGNACYMPFQHVFFSSRGLTSTQIGITFAAGALVSMIIQPVWGYIADRFLDKRKTLLITLCANTLIVLFFLKSHSFESVLFLIIFNGIFIYGIYPLIDAYTFDVIEDNTNLSFSHFRFMASAAYAVTNLILGYVIKFYGIDIVFIIYEVSAIVSIFLLFNMKYSGSKGHSNIQLKDFKEVAGNIRLIIFLLTILLMNGAIIGGSNYMNELIKYTQGDVSYLGMVWFITCIIEVVMFYFTGRLMRKFGIINVYLVSILIYCSKFVLDFIFQDALYIVAVQILEGVAFTMFLTSSMEYLNINTKPQMRASMVSIYSAFGGLGSFVAGLLGGIALNAVNPSQLYGIFAATCLAAFVLALCLKSGKNHDADAALTSE